MNLRQLPQSVTGVLGQHGTPAQVPMPIRDATGCLLASALPQVRLVKSARYLPDSPEVDASMASIDRLQGRSLPDTMAPQGDRSDGEDPSARTGRDRTSAG